MNEPQKQANWKKDTKDCMLYDFTYMKKAKPVKTESKLMVAQV